MKFKTCKRLHNQMSKFLTNRGNAKMAKGFYRYVAMDTSIIF